MSNNSVASEMYAYDVVIVGCGPAGIFTAYELCKKRVLDDNFKILMIDKGNTLVSRHCPLRDTGTCVKCPTCNIMSGFGGAGTFSDCKLSLHPIGVGGDVADFIGEDEAIKYAKKVEDIIASFDDDRDKRVVVGGKEDYNQAVKEFCSKSKNLYLTYCPTKHLGTDGTLKMMQNMYDYLCSSQHACKVDFLFKTALYSLEKVKKVPANCEKNVNYELCIASETNIKRKNDTLKRNIVNIIYATNVVMAVGRSGNSNVADIFVGDLHDIKPISGPVDIGVRVETNAEILEHVTDKLYDMKFWTFNDSTELKARTFCTNPRGYVSIEHYGENAVANGHSFADKKSHRTNFAILVTMNGKDFDSDTAQGFVHLINSLTDGRLLMSNLADLQLRVPNYNSGKYIKPTLDGIENVCYKPELYNKFYFKRTLTTIIDFIRILDSACMPGLYSDATYLYGPEVKFYSNRFNCDNHFRIAQNLYSIGDGSGITRGIIQSAITGLVAADNIITTTTAPTDA